MKIWITFVFALLALYMVNASTCGSRVVYQSPIINGKDPQPGYWPWQAALFLNEKFICGGSLISPQWIITAAHCVNLVKRKSAFKIVLGAHDLRQSKSFWWQVRKVAKVVVHPKYGFLNNDIAFLKLKKPAQLNSRVQIICLPKAKEVVPVGIKCFATGWGKIKESGSFYPILQQAALPIVSTSACQALSDQNYQIRISDQMVCAGRNSGNKKSTCHGDSGGPLVCATGPGGAFQLHGVVNWGEGKCDSRKSYTVFARITALRSFIKQQTGV